MAVAVSARDFEAGGDLEAGLGHLEARRGHRHVDPQPDTAATSLPPRGLPEIEA